MKTNTDTYNFSFKRREMLLGGSAFVLSGWLPSLAVSASVAEGVSWPGGWTVHELLQADMASSLDWKNLHKPVLASRIIDDMSSDQGWVASDAVKLGYADGQSRIGKRCMRFTTLLRNEDYIRSARSPNGSFNGQAVLFEAQPGAAVAKLLLDPPQDWSQFNRLSLWCYVHPTDNPVNSLSIQFLCDGASAGPADPISIHYFADLRPGEWNHLAWEIPEFQRDRISQLQIFQTLSGVPMLNANPEITYDIDEIRLERVDAERVEGWAVTAGTIAFSHVGYGAAARKMAVAPAGAASFDLLAANNDSVIASFPAAPMQNKRGEYQLLDFSSFANPGAYRLRHGDVVSASFPISETPWLAVTEAILNGFYGLRCGCAVAGVHDACHLDVFTEYQGERRAVGGGWHDAANLTQSPYRTHLAIYALVELYESLQAQGATGLAERALEEALWGLDWSLRMRFGPGLRTLYGTYSYWTDRVTGTIDDVLQEGDRSEVGKDAFQNTLALLAAVRAARALKARMPLLSSRLMQVATEDFAEVAPSIQPPDSAPALGINEPSWRDQVGYLVLAAVELFRATGDSTYADEAARLASWLVATQERSFVDGIPVTGYFYEDAGRTRIVHEMHNGFEDSGLLAFAGLCEVLPDHPDWMQWYAGLAFYCDYFGLRGAAASAPFNVIPSAVWRRSDIDAAHPEDGTGRRLATKPNPLFPTLPDEALIKSQMLKMFDAGAWLGPEYRLRVFPLWFDHVRHGATNVQLGKTIGVAAAASVLNRAELSELVVQQLEWVLGANPFSRSLVYGVGHDWWQNFTVSLPNLVGGLSLGFNSYSEDSPAWGNNAVFPYKEMWIYSSCRMAHLLSRAGCPARISGKAPAGAQWRNLRTGTSGEIPVGDFELHLPGGRYEFIFGGTRQTHSLADAAQRHLDLDPLSAIRFEELSREEVADSVTLKLQIEGAGQHRLSMRLFNISASGLPGEIDLSQAKTLEISISKTDPSMPWLMVIIPDGRLDDRFELGGGAPAWPLKAGSDGVS